MKEIKILGVRMDNLTRDQLREYFRQKLQGNKFCQVATVNPEFLVYAHDHPEFQKLLNTTDLNICDGFGISFFGRLLSGYKIQRITGVEVAEILCEVCAEKGHSVFFLGGFHVASKAATHMQKKYPALRIAGTIDGHEHSLAEVKNQKPDTILVAFGSPKQENWLSEKPSRIPSLRIGIGVGGTFDFWSGKVQRAPQWMRSCGIEWLYRLIKDPKRYKRIWRAVVIFPTLMIREKILKNHREE